jgi:hypothetical protein
MFSLDLLLEMRQSSLYHKDVLPTHLLTILRHDDVVSTYFVPALQV